MRPFISIIIGTARKSYGSMVGLEELHHLVHTFDSLEKQTFRNFEVVISDALYRSRDLSAELSVLGQWSFPWKVTHPESWWLDHNLWALQNGFNRGAIASSGEHLLFCGDCFQLEPNILSDAADFIKCGLSPHLLTIYRAQGFLCRHPEIPTEFKTVGELERSGESLNDKTLKLDSRIPFVLRDPVGFLGPNQCEWTWYYGYGFIPRADFFLVNGWDENFDGEKSLGDVELGSRLEMAGLFKMCLNRGLYIYEEFHGPVELLTHFKGFPVRSNYDLIWLMRNKHITRANSTAWSESECNSVIQAKVTNLKDWPTMPTAGPVFEAQRHWIENPAIFDLSDSYS